VKIELLAKQELVLRGIDLFLARFPTSEELVAALNIWDTIGRLQ